LVAIRPGTTQLARDAVAGELVREGPREPDQAGLSRHHGGALFGARVTAEATNGDDGAARPQMHESRPHGQKGPAQVYGQLGVPIRQDHVVERLFRPHGGIVDEDVEAAKALDGRRDEPFDGGRIAYVGQDRQHLSARGGDGGGDGLEGPGDHAGH